MESQKVEGLRSKLGPKEIRNTKGLGFVLTYSLFPFLLTTYGGGGGGGRLMYTEQPACLAGSPLRNFRIWGKCLVTPLSPLKARTLFEPLRPLILLLYHYCSVGGPSYSVYEWEPKPQNPNPQDPKP